MRVRNTAHWGIGKLYPTPAYFTEQEATEGLHTIQIGNQLLDLLIRDRNSPVTVITFQHRVSTRSTYPTLVGEGFTGTVGANLIAIADPSVALDNEVRLAWYLGNRAIGPLRPILQPIIKTALASLKSERLIFFGNSGGGIPALQFAADYPGSIAFTVNPALGINELNESDFNTYMHGCHPGLGRTAFRRVWSKYALSLSETIPISSDFHAAMYHNANDLKYLDAHHIPFVEARRNDLKIFERLDYDTPGHTPIPKEKLHSITRELSDMSKDEATALHNAGFNRSK